MPAAGRGERAGTGDLKQFRAIAGVPMLLRAVRPFTRHPRVACVVVALPSDTASHPPDWLGGLVNERFRLVRGGVTRADSVRAGLDALPAGCRIVLVHDAARPFVTRETVDAVIAAATQGVGVVPAVPVSDTLKQADGAGISIVATVPREALWRAQTPQGFPRHMLETAYGRWAGNGVGEATDDATVVQAAGFPVRLVRDETTNIKVTTPADFTLADALARQ